MNILHIRLKNCLETLLETQSALSRHLRVNLAADFGELQMWLDKVDNMRLEEEDVQKLERLTADFLREARLAGAVSLIGSGRAH